MFTKETWREYLKEYKLAHFPDAPATPERYADNSEKLLLQDLKKDIIPAKHGDTYTFYPHDNEGALLKLDAKNEIPEFWKMKFQAYYVYALDMGYVLDIWTLDGEANTKKVIITSLKREP